MKNILLLLLLFCSQAFLFAQSDINTARKLMEARKFEQAKPIIEKHLEKNPSDHKSRQLLGQCLIQEGKFDKAIVEFKSIKKPLEKESDFHFWFGQAYLGKLNASKNFFEKGIIASKVKSYFETAVALDPENLTARNSLARYYLTAPGIAGGSSKKAKEQLDYIKSKNPRMGYYGLASYYFQKKDYPAAKAEYLQYLKLTEDKSEVYYQLGFVAQTEKNYQEAFKYFELALEEEEVYKPAYYQLARTAIFTESRLEDGLKNMLHYIEVGGDKNGPDLASAHWRLGMIYELLKQKEKAITAYQKSLKLDPGHQQAGEALEKLK